MSATDGGRVLAIARLLAAAGVREIDEIPTSELVQSCIASYREEAEKIERFLASDARRAVTAHDRRAKLTALKGGRS